MPLARALSLAAVILALVTAAIAGATRAGNGALAATVAGVVPLCLWWLAVRLNGPMWAMEAKRVTPHAAPIAARRNAALLACAYAWGGLTLLTVYPLAGLRWYHWWQYGGLMALVALGLAVYARAIGKSDSTLRSPPRQLVMLRLVLLHAMAIVAGLGWLVISGKWASERDDWVANVVFIAGGAALAGLSAIAAYTQQRLTKHLNGA